MKKHLTKAILILSIFSPLSAFATTDFSGLGKFINDIKNNVIVNLSTLFLTTAVVAFFWGVVVYIYGIRNGVADKQGEGRNFMLWGLIALFVMFSVWGIVTFAQKTLGIEGTTSIQIPSIRFQDTGGSAQPAGAQPAGNAAGNLFQNVLDNIGNNSGGSNASVPGASQSDCPTNYIYNGTNCIFNATF